MLTGKKLGLPASMGGGGGKPHKAQKAHKAHKPKKGKNLGKPSGARVVSEWQREVEDAVSSVLSAMFIKETATCLSDIAKDLDGEASVFCHGSLAVKLWATRLGLVQRYNDMDPADDDGMLTLLTDEVRDIDAVVMTREGVEGCSTLQACLSQNEAMMTVAAHLRTLRHKVHNGLRDRDTHAEFLASVSAKLDGRRVELVHVPHIHIERDSDDNVMLYTRGKGKRMTCTPDNMVAVGDGGSGNDPDACYPTRDSFNLGLEFPGAVESITHAFVLARLAVAIKVDDKDFKVNFFDVSVPKDNDYVYEKVNYVKMPRVVSLAISDADMLVPPLSHLMDSAGRQLVNLAKANGDDPKLVKLRYRIELITLLKAIQSVTKDNGEADTGKPLSDRDLSKAVGFVTKDAPLRGIIGDLVKGAYGQLDAEEMSALVTVFFEAARDGLRDGLAKRISDRLASAAVSSMRTGAVSNRNTAARSVAGTRSAQVAGGARSLRW